MNGHAAVTFTTLRLLIIGASFVVFGASPIVAQDHTPMTVMLTRDFRQSPGGIPIWTECHLLVRVIQGKGHALNQCADQSADGPKLRGIAAQRELTSIEVARLIDLVGRSDLYGGGSSENLRKAPPPETVTLACCGRAEMVALETFWNLSFDQGPRRELVELLRGWRRELIGIAQQELKEKR